MVSSTDANPFRLARPGQGALERVLAGAAERLLGLSRLAEHHQALPRGLPAADFVEAALRELRVSVEPRREPEGIPAEGPLLVVANHPTGGLEGLALASLLLERRGDLRVLANELLTRIPGFGELTFAVDPFGRRDAAWSNGLAWRRAARHLTGGGALLAFPAGEVAHLRRRSGAVEEGPWSPAIGALIRHARPAVLTVHVAGRNSAVFQLAGLVHPLARTLLLPRALLALRGRALPVTVGPVMHVSPEPADPDERVAASLRARCLLQGLGGRDAPRGRARRRPPSREPLAEPVDPRRLHAEMSALPVAQLLVRSGGLEAWSFRARQAPSVLREIGRLRELAFRAVGEGTGAALDLDRFDGSYHHLVAWHPEQRAVVGAYRIGVTTELLPGRGAEALYTHELFRLAPELLEELGPALELGRSFVRPEDQRSFHALQLLWKGIGRFVVRRPDHATLFGPVSTSADYRRLSRELIAAHLAAGAARDALARHVRPRRPFRHRLDRRSLRLARELDGLAGLSAVVSAIEPDGKGLPVLLRQYAKLGARVLGVNVDRHFSDVVDALVVVDLKQTPRRVLQRYMGATEAARFLAGPDAA